MENKLLEAMKRRVTKVPMYLVDETIVVGRAVYYYDIDYLPLSANQYSFCQVEEIFLKNLVEYTHLTSETIYCVKLRQGFVDRIFYYAKDFDELILRNKILKKPHVQAEERLYLATENNIYSVNYPKLYLKDKIYLKLYYLEEFGFEWVESFEGDMLSYTLVRKK